MSWTAVSAFVLDQVFGYQTANYIRENLIALASARFVYSLGGSRTVALARTASALDAVDWLDVEIDGTNGTGFTNELQVEVRTLNAGTSITPTLRNVTDATTAGTGTACTATSADYSGTSQKQVIAVTIASGIKKYRLQGTPSNTTNDTFIIGVLRRYATA